MQHNAPGNANRCSCKTVPSSEVRYDLANTAKSAEQAPWPGYCCRRRRRPTARDLRYFPQDMGTSQHRMARHDQRGRVVACVRWRWCVQPTAIAPCRPIRVARLVGSWLKTPPALSTRMEIRTWRSAIADLKPLPPGAPLGALEEGTPGWVWRCGAAISRYKEKTCLFGRFFTCSQNINMAPFSLISKIFGHV